MSCGLVQILTVLRRLSSNVVVITSLGLHTNQLLTNTLAHVSIYGRSMSSGNITLKRNGSLPNSPKMLIQLVQVLSKGYQWLFRNPASCCHQRPSSCNANNTHVVGLTVHKYDSSTEPAEAGGSRVQGQPEQKSKTYLQNTKTKK